MSNYIIEERIIGDHRIRIYPDYNAGCPVTNWDMSAGHLFEHLERGRYFLCDDCDWKEWVSTSRDHSLADLLHHMAAEVVAQKDIIAYLKAGKAKDVRLIYNRSERQWELQCRSSWSDNQWTSWWETDPTSLKKCDCRMELLDPLDEKDYIELIKKYAKDFVLYEWQSSGYSQGDHIRGISYMSKERFDRTCGFSGKYTTWQEQAMSIIEAEVKEIGMWAWGDVKGFVLEKKVSFTKVYDDEDREDEKDAEWEEVDSCWGYFMETEELIAEIISEHDLKETA